MALASAALSLAGCAATDPLAGAATTPSVAVSVPSGGVPLSAFGIKNGPAWFSVPAGIQVQYSVDQINVVTLVLNQVDGQAVHSYLGQNLTAMGTQVHARSADSLLFTGSGWQGALTISDGEAGLTLRRQG